MQVTIRGKIMTGFYKIKTISMVLAISSLLVSLPSCKENGSAEKIGEKIDSVVENIGEELDEAAKNVSKKINEAAKNASEKLDVAAKKTSEKAEEVSDSIRNAIKKED